MIVVLVKVHAAVGPFSAGMEQSQNLNEDDSVEMTKKNMFKKRVKKKEIKKGDDSVKHFDGTVQK